MLSTVVSTAIMQIKENTLENKFFFIALTLPFSPPSEMYQKIAGTYPAATRDKV